MHVLFKICGLTRPEDAAVAEEAGASYGGVILAPGRKRSVSIEQAKRVFADRKLRRCGVFVDASAAMIRRAADDLRLSVAQLHGDESAEFARSLREAGLTVWKAVRPRTGGDFIRAVQDYRHAVDGLLLDGWSPLGPGGTGTRFPWVEVAPARSSVDPSVQLIVAGGLTAGNVADAIAMLDPDVVDVSSGVETSAGIKDAALIQDFAEAIRGVVVRGEMNR